MERRKDLLKNVEYKENNSQKMGNNRREYDNRRKGSKVDNNSGIYSFWNTKNLCSISLLCQNR